MIALARGRRCRPLVVIALALACVGCAEHRIRTQADEDRGAGRHDKAVRDLEAGLRDHPDSTILRSGLLQARTEALARHLATAAQARAGARLDEARRELELALALEPAHPRIAAMLAELEVARGEQRALEQAEQALAERKPDLALRTVRQALRSSPHHAGMLAMLRRLESETGVAPPRAGQVRLHEVRPISLDFRDANLRTVLDAVARHSGVNFILDRDIKPDARVTMFMRDAPLETALDLLTQTSQLAKKVVDPRTVVLYPSTPDKQREYQEQIVRVFHLTSADAKAAAALLKAMLRLKEPFVDERANIVSIRDSADNVELAERLLAIYDAGEPEVLLELEVLEVSSTRLNELGVKFPESLTLTPLGPTGVAGDLTLGNVQGLGSNRIGLGLSGLLINLKRELRDFNTLANPRVRVRNREKAKVLVGDRIPVITTTSSGTTGFVSESVNYLDVGLKLEVEPTIYVDSDVAIKVALEVSTLGSQIKTAAGTQAFQIGTRSASTLLRLHDGQTQLLAGLISREERDTSQRLPGLGDVPVLGRLFSNQIGNGSRTELVLAITPHILRNVRRLTAAEAELAVGTDSAPKLRQPLAVVPPAPSGRVTASDSAGAAASPATGPTTAPTTALSTGSSTGPTTAVTTQPSSAPSPALVSGTEGARPSAPTPLPASGTAHAFELRWSGANTGEVGRQVELELELASEAAARGMPLEVAYDAKRLKLVAVTQGEYFARDGAKTAMSHSSADSAGIVRISIVRNAAKPVAGRAALVRLSFEPVQSGAAEVRINWARPLGAAGNLRLPAPWTVNVK